MYWIDVYSVAQRFDAVAKGSTACTVEVVKGLDKAGPLLFGAAVIGQNLTTVQIDIVDSGDKPLKFYEIVLTNTRVVAMTSMPDTLAETLTLVGDSITVKYWPQKADGTLDAPVSAMAACK